MKAAILTLMLVGCVSQCPKPPPCPMLPPIGASEPLKDYTIKIGNMYNECAKGVTPEGTEATAQ